MNTISSNDVMVMEEETSSRDDSSHEVFHSETKRQWHTLTHVYRTNEKSVESTVMYHLR